MGYNIKYIVNGLEVKFSSGSFKDVVIGVQGTLSGDYNGNHGMAKGAIMVNVPPPVSGSYIEYKDLTNADVVGFIQDTNEYKSMVSTLTSEIHQDMQAPTQGLCALPWE